MEKKILAFIVVLSLSFLIIGRASAYYIEDTTDVGKGKSWTDDDSSFLGWTDYIGDGFNLYAMDISQQGDDLTIIIYTDFSGSYNDGNLQLGIADLFLNLDGSSSTGLYGYELGVCFEDFDEYGQSQGTIYYVDTDNYTTSHDIVEDEGSYYYGEYWGNKDTNALVQASSTSDIGSTTMSKSSNNSGQNDADYIWTLTLDLCGLGYEGLNSEIGIYFASATCANDIMEVKVPGAPVPEPATMLLFGSGLVGLVYFSRYKFINRG